MQALYYFAYGSNMDIDQMRRRCPGSRFLEKGRLAGYKLDFTHRSSESKWNGGVADIVETPGSEVWGLIYELSPEDLGELDRREGYPKGYSRFQCAIKTSTDIVHDVWVYYVVKKDNFIPSSKEYMEIIRSAALKYQFPDSYCAYLDTIPSSNR